ncbi:MAG: transglutaminase domain-containing protein [Deltaproteobacteria bacterium]|uniref:Transglutaminase domain-containing protein n=1 Tax=Candidatus Zymogenus saltonus TaxID=2844893 RepID=A0A9D8PNU6_9DELT|nr:transglutaminase domain-containing protein [Candidatus Zymogenus saltonus]
MFRQRIIGFFTLILLSFGLLFCSGTTKYEREFEGYREMETVADDWYSTYLLDMKAGYDHIRVTKGLLGDREVVRIVEEGAVVFIFDEKKGPVVNDIYGEAFLTADEDRDLLGFMYRMTVLSHGVLIEGIRSGDYILVDFHSGGGEQHIKFSADQNIYPSVALTYIAIEEAMNAAKGTGFVPGQKFKYRVFIENLKVIKDMEVEVLGVEEVVVGGEKSKLFKVETKIEGYKSTSWVGIDGRVVKEITLERFEAKLTDKEKAQDLDGAGITYGDILEIALVPSDKRIKNPEGLKLLRVKIDNFPKTSSALTGDFQSLEGPDDRMGYIFTMRRGEVEESAPVKYGDFPDDVKEYLLPSIDVESDNRLIVAKAKEIAGDGKDPVKDAEKILDWVFENVEKKMVDATSALDALNTLEGECESHAYLLAALLRARGIPAKVVSGIVYSEGLDGFFFHAWNEVYLGRWIPVDATFGQFPADPTHIKFSEGGRSSLFDIVSLIGSIKVDVLEMVRD